MPARPFLCSRQIGVVGVMDGVNDSGGNGYKNEVL